MPVIRSRSSKSTVPSLSFLHWFSPHLAVPAGASWNSEMVLCVRFQNRVGRSAENPPVTVITSATTVNVTLCMASSPALLKVSGQIARTEEPGMAGASGGCRRQVHATVQNDSAGCLGITKGIDTIAVGGLTISSHLRQLHNRRLVTD